MSLPFRPILLDGRLRGRARPSVEKRKKGHNKRNIQRKTCSMVTAFPKRLHFSCPRRQASVDRRFRWIVEHCVDISKFLALWTDVWLVWRVLRKSPDLWGSRTKCGAGGPQRACCPAAESSATGVPCGWGRVRSGPGIPRAHRGWRASCAAAKILPAVDRTYFFRFRVLPTRTPQRRVLIRFFFYD